MGIEQEDLNPIEKELWPDEQVVMTARQRRVGPGASVITPTSVVVTNKRVIIINRETLGLRKDIESIPYDKITGVRWEHGIISSSVFLRITGYSTNVGFLKRNQEEGEIDGLNNNDAMAVSDYIEKKISSESGSVEGESDTNPNDKDTKYCSACGAKNPADAKFCESCGKKL